MTIKYPIIPILLFIFLCSCKKDKNAEAENQPINKFSDPLIKEIYDLQDKRDTQALLPYLKNNNPEIRKSAALAFASIQDTIALPQLSQLLVDDSTEVRIAAAYALGQLKNAAAEIYLFHGLETENTPLVRKEMLEALGKCIKQENISYFHRESGDDALTREGLAWGLYRAGIRNVYDDSTTMVVSYLLDSVNSYETRLAAAHYLSRIKDLDIKDYQDQVIQSALYDKAGNVRIASTLALKHLPNQKTIDAVSKKLIYDRDYRVRINAIKVLNEYEISASINSLLTSLNDENTNVAIEAAQVIFNNATKAEISLLRPVIDKAKHWRVKSILLGTLLKLNPHTPSLTEEIKTRFDSSKNPYEKAALLTALANDIQLYQFIVTETFQANQKAISTAGMEALGKIRANPKFSKELENDFIHILQTAIESKDPAIIGIAANIMSQPKYNLKGKYKNTLFLSEAKEHLKVPKDNEALQSLQKAIDYFHEAEEAQPVTNPFNHPIEWELTLTIPKYQKAKITTPKGEIILELMVEEAPGTVTNFFQLLKQGYFSGKNFHRVVPNFVVQGGCNRGDGWGSEHYSIRSEFAKLNYREGYVGMASAGKDTESAQWFITHSPTPHLDGRYTIFAKVVEGMDVVHNLQIGDKIQSITIL